MTIVAYIMLGAPFSWGKFRGGMALEWVGYYIDLASFKLGISIARTSWLIKYIKEATANGAVLIRRFAEALGRLSFSAQVLCWMLAPLYAWSASVPGGSVLKVPLVVKCTLLYLERQLEEGKSMIDCTSFPTPSGEMFRADSKGDQHFIVLGGWECSGGSDLKNCRWFSIRIKSSEVPWLFKPNDGGSSWSSTSHEMLATMAALILFDSGSNASSTLGWATVTATTDNQANSKLADKLSSSKVPLMFVVMQLSILLAKKRVFLDLRWQPREMNSDADDLTNNRFDKFSPSLRIESSWDLLKPNMSVLMELLGMQEEFVDTLTILKTGKVQKPQTGTVLRRRSKRKLDKSLWE
jgi:hypothetical protein